MTIWSNCCLVCKFVQLLKKHYLAKLKICMAYDPVSRLLALTLEKNHVNMHQGISKEYS